jgi:hypothetical protein
VSTAVAAIKDAYSDAVLFEMVCQIRIDGLDHAGPHEVVHHICSSATPDIYVLGSTTPDE